MASTERYRYDQEQLKQYFDRLALPEKRRVFDVTSLSNDEQFGYLCSLIKHHQVRITFENLVQHYSWHRVIDVSPLHIFRKVMSQPGRGGYCMEANTLLHSLLYSLGFNCYPAAGRVWVPPEKRWTGWTHMINLVMIGDEKYLCDVGFGANEPTVPIPLKHGAVRPQVSPCESRLSFQQLEQGLSSNKVWIYQYRIDSQADWMPTYCFTETELLPSDIPEMNYSPWLSRTIHFTQQVICVRFTTDKEEDEPGLASQDAISEGDIDGTLIIDDNKMKWRRHGKNTLQLEFKSEDERVEALRKYWGIELDIEDRQAILGTVAAVKTTA